MGSPLKYIVIQLIKIALVVILTIALFWIGAMVGYSVLGEGQASKVFDNETWTHITDFFK